MVGDQSILGSINKRLDGLDNMFDGKLKEEVEILEDKIKYSEQVLQHEQMLN